MEIRAEHDSLEEYLAAALTPEQREHVLFVSFSQWAFALAALADTAMALHRLDARISLGFWTAHTPLRDTGWSSSRLLSRLTGAPARDQRVQAALLSAGIERSAVVRPPIRRWRPSEQVTISRSMNRTEIRALTYHGSPMGRAILSVLPETQTPTTDTFFWPRRWVRACARSYAYAYDQASAAIRQRSATAVVVYNGRFLHDRAAAAAAEAAGIPVLYYDTGGLDTDFDLTDVVTHDWSDLQRRMLKMYADWPAVERDDLGAAWFQQRLDHAAPDNELFVETQQRGSMIERPQADCVVVYFSSSGDEIAELELDWSTFIGDQPQALGYLADECRSRPGYSLIVRSHPHKRLKPKQDVDEWFEAVDRARVDVHLDPYSSIDSYELMRMADIVVTYGSTTGVEAAFAGKPVIVLGPSAYDQLGCATMARTPAALSAALDVRVPGSWAGAVAYGLMMRRRGFIFESVVRDADGGFELAGQPFVDARPIVLHLSNLFSRLQRWYLRR